MSTKKTTIGGQAIIEGIVMKGPKKTCTVVRKPGGELVTKTEPAHPARRVHAVHRHEGRHRGHQLFGGVFRR